MANLEDLKPPSEEQRPAKGVVVYLSRSVTDLIDVLKIFENFGISINHLESCVSKGGSKERRDYYINFAPQPREEEIRLISALKEVAPDVTVRYADPECSDSDSTSHPKKGEFGSEVSVPWFPRKIQDLKTCCTTLYKFGYEFSSDQAGYGDIEYKQRRKEIAELAYNYEYGKPIPRVKYRDFEIETWGKVFNTQSSLFETHACKEYKDNYPSLFDVCGYRRDNIPQLEDVSQYLRSKTGWQLWPVLGWISSRHFLNCLAFRVFPTTQYVRHKSSPFYTPEPDICHEILGHAPLFCDANFARFSQEIGLASLGVSDEWIMKLAGVYWFTVEFGMVREDGELKAYGAGLLGGNEELQYCTGNKPEHKPFNIEQMMVQKYPETGLQPAYFVADSLDSMKDKMIEFARTIPRPFSVRFEPYTQSVDVLDSWESVQEHARGIQEEMNLLCSAMRRNF